MQSPELTSVTDQQGALQLAMRETAKLTKFSHLHEERRVIEADRYVDDILSSHNDQEELDKITEGVENILNPKS